MSSGDYTGNDSIIVPFPSCSMRECITIPIINDNILEYQERLTVSLERPADVDSRIELVYPTLKVVMKTVCCCYIYSSTFCYCIVFSEIVIDFTGPTVAIEENNGIMQVCFTVITGNIDCPSAKPDSVYCGLDCKYAIIYFMHKRTFICISFL